METEIRTKTSPLMAKLIAAVRAHAREFYAEGWDSVVEAYEDSDLIETIGYCRTEKGAIDAVAKALDLRAEVAWDRGDDPANTPKPTPVPRMGATPTPRPTELEGLKAVADVLAGTEDGDAARERYEQAQAEADRLNAIADANADEQRQKVAELAERFGTDGAEAAALALEAGQDLDETPLTVEEAQLIEEGLAIVDKALGDEDVDQSVAVCGCPIAVLEDEGHQEGCSEHRRAGRVEAEFVPATDEQQWAEHLDEIAAGTKDAEAKPKRTRAPRGTGKRRTGTRNAQAAQIKSDPNCTWEGHAAAMDENGFCPVCQH